MTRFKLVFSEAVRSIGANLSNSVAVVLYEAWRQVEFWKGV